jgi:hypothetical protein
MTLWEQTHRLRRISDEVGIGPPRSFGGAGHGIHVEWSTKFRKGYGYDFVEFYDYDNGYGLDMCRRNSDGTICVECKNPTDDQIRSQLQQIMRIDKRNG